MGGEARGPSNQELRDAASSPWARRFSIEYLEEHELVPLGLGEDGRLRVAVGRQLDPTVLDELSLTFGHDLELVSAPAAEIRAAILSAASDGEAEAPVDGWTEGGGGSVLDDLRALASEAPVIQLVNLMLLEAVESRASDIHVQPSPDGLRIRHRVDGVLRDVATHPAQYRSAVISRIKIMSELDIAERRKPQDGRVRLQLSDRELDVRISTLPSVQGESVVLRLLDRTEDVRTVDGLGMDDVTQKRFRRMVQSPTGIVLVTGPTGSGKTTTMYAALQSLNSPEVKIVTVEDPVEYQIPGLVQVAVDAKAGRTFSAALRSILRHDPDVVMVGEMRDSETAEIAVQAALTGHLVLSTLHTNDAPGGVTRLMDMGVEAYLLAATVRGILAQRLVRRVCPGCRRPHALDEAERSWAAGLALDVGRGAFARGEGCDHCSGTGFFGRVGVYELMEMSDEARSMVLAGASLDALRDLAVREGMTPLHRAAWSLAEKGVTTVGAVARLVGEHD